MSVCCKDKLDAEIIFVKGALEKVLTMCSSFNNWDHVEQMSPSQAKMYTEEAYQMGSAGLRGE